MTLDISAPTQTDPVDRAQALASLSAQAWDLVVIGGGASGLGTAMDAAARGYKTLVIEQSDFGKGTSSRSTKLIHGGVRYLRQGNIRLVRESLLERGRLLKNAQPLVQPLPFIIPTASTFQTAYYASGLKAYDLLAGSSGLGWSKALSGGQMSSLVPGLQHSFQRSGVMYHDAQFDDARLCIALLGTISRLGGTALNYMAATAISKRAGKIHGIVCRDVETQTEYEVTAKVVVNATGIFSDEIRRMDDPSVSESLRLSQGSHLVLDGSFFPGEHAVIVPETEDGRVLFFIPWHGALLIGTTDVPVNRAVLEPESQAGEIEYLLEYGRRYLARAPQLQDVKSVFAGLRPLVKADSRTSTSKLPRDHVIEVSNSGLVTLAGGKWTTFRHMGEETVDEAVKVGGMKVRSCQSRDLQLTEGGGEAGWDNPQQTHREVAEGKPVSPDWIRHCIRYEMARRVEDVLARRSRVLFLDARAAQDRAADVARIMAAELGHSDDWVQEEVRQFQQLAANYLPRLATRSAAT